MESCTRKVSYEREFRPQNLKFHPLFGCCSDMLITELNIITQMQHQLRSKRQLTECLRNVAYLTKFFLAGNHDTFSKTQWNGGDDPSRTGVVKIWRLENQESGIRMGAGMETGTGIGTGTE